MDNKADIPREFKAYAEEKYTNHKAELDTRYGNEKIDTDTLTQAYQEHQKMLRHELEEKINSILPAKEDNTLKGELENIKHTYVGKINLHQF